eukprot:TRINITY_DN3771_c0_g1_i1.p1 TRINITY_DN3771_c0_g1~~TRINITY_DN3771_c0_g1_i1.p1  ORF type:complete len:153 (+),score=5.53 TRINITY_DN3771_c0_g1_i1:61-519(+)
MKKRNVYEIEGWKFPFSNSKVPCRKWERKPTHVQGSSMFVPKWTRVETQEMSIDYSSMTQSSYPQTPLPYLPQTSPTQYSQYTSYSTNQEMSTTGSYQIPPYSGYNYSSYSSSSITSYPFPSPMIYTPSYPLSSASSTFTYAPSTSTSYPTS